MCIARWIDPTEARTAESTLKLTSSMAFLMLQPRRTSFTASKTRSYLSSRRVTADRRRIGGEGAGGEGGGKRRGDGEKMGEANKLWSRRQEVGGGTLDDGNGGCVGAQDGWCACVEGKPGWWQEKAPGPTGDLSGKA